MLSFPRRDRVEKMDLDKTPDEEIGKALDALGRAHRLFGSYRSICHAVEGLLPMPRGPLRVLDVGAGGGDLGRVLRSRFGTSVHYIRLDHSERILRIRKPTSQSSVLARVPGFPFPDRSVDLVVSLLLLHHLDDAQVSALLETSLRLARHTVIHQDLVRSPLFYLAFKLFSRFFTSNQLVHHDGPVSIQRSRTRREWETFLHEQSIPSYSLENVFPWRVNLVARSTSGVMTR